MKGCYALLIHLKKGAEIGVGSLGVIHFTKGHYIYIGSAMNGIEGRVRRHLREKKKLHWHIDYFLKEAEISAVYYLENGKGLECILAERFAKKFEVVPKFGSSDCGCRGHLFYGERGELDERTKECGMREFSI